MWSTWETEQAEVWWPSVLFNKAPRYQGTPAAGSWIWLIGGEASEGTRNNSLEKPQLCRRNFRKEGSSRKPQETMYIHVIGGSARLSICHPRKAEASFHSTRWNNFFPTPFPWLGRKSTQEIGKKPTLPGSPPHPHHCQIHSETCLR